MKALVRDESVLELRDVPKPAPKPGEVLIRVAAAAVCRTDVLAAQGRIPTRRPVILGHEFSGTVEISRHPGVAEGARVAVMPVIPCGRCPLCRERRAEWCPRRELMGVDRDGAFAEYAAVPASAVWELADGVSFELAAYAEPVAASLAVLKGGMTPSERGVLYGDNRISRLNERVLKAHGRADLTVHDPSRGRALKENSFDYAVESLATPEALEELVGAVRPGGVIVLRSRWTARLSLPLARAVEKEIRFQAVHYGSFLEAVSLVSSDRLGLRDLISPPRPLEDYARVLADSGEKLKPFFTLEKSDVRDRRRGLLEAAR